MFRNENAPKKKRLINLCEHLSSPKKFSNENIPSKLLNELALLSTQNFKIAIKSKFQSLVLPLSKNAVLPIDQIKPDDEEMELSDPDENSLEKGVLTESNSVSSPLVNDYVILKCDIINRSLTLVPPIRIFVPYNYPDTNPFVDCVQIDEFEDDMLPDYSKFT